MNHNKDVHAGLSGKTSLYRRVIIKLSGESLTEEGRSGISFQLLKEIAAEIAEVHALGVEMAVVIGGGNIFRGRSVESEGIDRATGDYMGMLATVINALALQDALEKMKIPTRVLTAIEMKAVAEPYIRRRAIRHLEKGRVVIFACGTGNPFFTTDTAASLRAAEIHADAILKATKVDGVYDKDPEVYPEATKFEEISFQEVLTRNLKVMDPTAISMLRDLKIPVFVFNIRERGNMKKILLGEKIGTSIRGG